MGIGLAMGTADIIPGVSGGTIAFISGIYDQLITSIAHVDMQLWRHIKHGQRKKAWIYIQGSFLVQLFSGIILAIILLAHLMSYLLETYPTYVFAFFFGLILASIALISYQHLPKRPSLRIRGALLGGLIAGYLLTTNITLAETMNPSLLAIFFSWAFASIAMILPGISGSYILLLLGKYEYILDTLKTQLDLIGPALREGQFLLLFQQESMILGLFILGIIWGLIGFSKLLHRLLRHYHTMTLAVLIGFMLWSLHTIRPWSTSLHAQDWLITLLLCAGGGGIIWLIYFFSTTKKTTS